jgi:hypothetical protein
LYLRTLQLLRQSPFLITLHNILAGNRILIWLINYRSPQLANGNLAGGSAGECRKHGVMVAGCTSPSDSLYAGYIRRASGNIPSKLTELWLGLAVQLTAKPHHVACLTLVASP